MGRAYLPEAIKTMRRLTLDHYVKAVNKLIYYNKQQLEAHMNHPNTIVLDLMIGHVLIEAINRGDDKRLESVITRLIGIVPKKYQLTDHEGKTSELVITSEDLQKKIESIDAEFESMGDE